jgi:hypothetical protein
MPHSTMVDSIHQCYLQSEHELYDNILQKFIKHQRSLLKAQVGLKRKFSFSHLRNFFRFAQ